MSSRRKSSTKPEGLSQLNLNAAGIDVGATSHYVAVPADRAVREFEAFTADPGRLAFGVRCGDGGHGVHRRAGYRCSGCWRSGLEVMLVDPRRIKNVPGRKTDVLDCQLHTSCREPSGRGHAAQLPADAACRTDPDVLQHVWRKTGMDIIAARRRKTALDQGRRRPSPRCRATGGRNSSS